MIDRAVLAVLMLVCLSSPVFALGIIKDTIPEKINLELDHTKTVSFMIRGDSVEKQIELFAKSSNSEVLDINNKAQFSQNTTLSPYQNRTVTLTLEGIKEGNSTVTYGARVKSSGSGTVGFDQVVQDTFTVSVYCNSSCDIIPAKATTTRKSSGGGGGGGGSILTTTSVTEEEPVSPIPAESSPSANMDSLTGTSSATSEMVVQNDVQSNTDVVGKVVESISESVSGVADKTHLKTLGLLLFFSVGTLGTSVGVIALKRGTEK